MGKRGGRRGGRGGGKPNARQNQVRYNSREEVTKSNVRYEEYYESLDLVEDDEKETFWSFLRQELPNSFRFTGSKSQALPVQQLLRDRYIPEITSITYNGEAVAPPTPVPWFPDQLAWQMTTPKSIVRKFGPFAAFQKFLVSETSVGNISRQEVVSMIPPLLLDLRPGMTALDMCAAPGSKAAQLIELVHGSEEARMRKTARKAGQDECRDVSPDGAILKDGMDEDKQNTDWSDDGRATGLLIANDADYKRAHMLTHQMKRLNSPNLIVTNHDATMYPSIKLPSDSVQNKYLKFDRILADVPCSGDGTARKNLNVWKDWVPGNALGLHSTQHRILTRGLQMLKAGGRLVYSTCSINPVENEAVVSSAIERCGGLSKVDIVDCSADLPALKRKSGLRNWKVMDKTGSLWKTWQDFENHQIKSSEENRGKLTKGMFPSSKDQLPLHHCMRIYPHMQDTGGFFIAVLEKKTEIKAKPESEVTRTETQPGTIVAAVSAIEQQPANGTNPIEKVDALDSVVPISVDGDTEDSSAAARQNRAVAPNTSLSANKRSSEAVADAAASTKRPKIRDEIDEPRPQAEVDRLVHWPPPPSATLDISRPETLIQEDLKTPPSNNISAYNSHNRQPEGLPLRKRNQPFEEPFKYLDPSNSELDDIYDFYNLSSRFPRDRFMVRNAMGTPTKTIYYTSSLARDILTTNTSSGIKFVHCGVKMFVKQDVQGAGVCRWRIQSEGLPLLEAWAGEKRSVRMYKRSTLRTLLVEMFAKIEGEGWNTTLGEIGGRVRDIGMGCCVLRVEKSEGGKTEDGEEGFSERIVLPLWRSLYSLNLMLPKEDRKAMLIRLYNDDTPLQDNSKDRFNNKKHKHGTTEVENAEEEHVAAIEAESVKGEDIIKNEEGAVEDSKEDIINEEKVIEEDVSIAGLGEQMIVDTGDDDDEGGVPLKEDDMKPESRKQD
ncbi:uncharacterized protein KY384_007053 [Bacidia gigantensis]|uniref:uncharacterized protein n=1 Tax=Bacidia gigantensis TaxID=2732470 RepID=UPI001D059E36|nr:uncharacterized protein KY384_007053 [Bacidia gigantensis]KAG8528137.1 hypothetical protein KY384_007053 [Bacidia gigantensis]